MIVTIPGIAQILRGSLLSEEGYVSPSTGMIKTPTSSQKKQESLRNDSKTTRKTTSESEKRQRQKATRRKELFGEDSNSSCTSSTRAPESVPTKGTTRSSQSANSSDRALTDRNNSQEVTEQNLGLELSSSSESDSDSSDGKKENDKTRAFVRRRKPVTLGNSSSK